MIILPRQTTFAGLEQFLRDVRQSPGQDLSLPMQVSHGGSFSFSAVAVQCIATWARLHGGKRRLNLAPNFADDENTQARVAGSLFSMSGLYFAQEIVAGRQVIPRHRALQAVAPRVFAMQDYQYQDTLRGQSAALCCFEGAKLEFLNSLYAAPRRGSPETTTIRSASEFASILPRMLDACATGASTALTTQQTLALAQLVHQLFKNADVHTSSDADGRLYDSGVRGIQVREVRIADEAVFAAFVSEDRALHAYLTKLGNRHLIREQGARGMETRLDAWQSSRFIEITVFDTGPGLALRWLARRKGITRYAEVDREQELEAVKACFQLHATTHSAAMKGDGLPIALGAMKDLQAFMFLRTGRLALFQDFSSGLHSEFAPRHRYGQRHLAEAAGATYSICFPL
ncbi:MAG: hypothetical protein Q8N06_15155 [Hydrogenophaga sp.]|nr:hypothetical protein [Hydrogenophaga sp.]